LNTQRTQNPPTFGSWGFDSPPGTIKFPFCFDDDL
jgi:hypothetical protein